MSNNNEVKYEPCIAHPPPASHMSKEAQELMQMLNQVPPFDPAEDHEGFRTVINEIENERLKSLDESVEVTPVDCNGIQCYWINSPEQSKHSENVILFVHGGAFIAGEAGNMIELPLRLGQAAGMKVLSVDYRLAPENAWPAGLEDCLSAHNWLLKSGYQTNNISWAGISSGGGLVLSMANVAKQRCIDLPAAIYSMSAWADLTLTGDSYATITPSDHFMGHSNMAKLVRKYIGDADPSDPTISAIYGDLSGLPPTRLDVGSREVIVSDSIRWARKAKSAGVDVTLDIWDGLLHGFQVLPELPEAHEATNEGAKFLLKHMILD